MGSVLLRRTLRGRRLAPPEPGSPTTPVSSKEPRLARQCGLLALPSDLLELAALKDADYTTLTSLAQTCTAFRALSSVRRNAHTRSGGC